MHSSEAEVATGEKTLSGNGCNSLFCGHTCHSMPRHPSIWQMMTGHKLKVVYGHDRRLIYCWLAAMQAVAYKLWWTMICWFIKLVRLLVLLYVIWSFKTKTRVSTTQYWTRMYLNNDGGWPVTHLSRVYTILQIHRWFQTLRWRKDRFMDRLHTHPKT